MKKKLILTAFISLSLILISSISITVAYFTFGSKLAVSNINVSFKGDENLLISTKPSDYKENLNDEELTSNMEMSPVSSMYSDAWINQKQSTPSFRAAYSRPDYLKSNTYRESSEANGGYFKQDLYLYSSYPVVASIDKDGLLLKANEELNKKIAQKVLDETHDQKAYDLKLKNLNNVIKSIRMSILVPSQEHYQYVVIDPMKDKETMFCGHLKNFMANYYDYYFDKDSGEYKEYVYGQYDNIDKIVYDDPKNVDSTLVGEENIFNSVTKKGVKRFNLEKSIANGLTNYKENAFDLPSAEDKLEIFINQGEPTKIVVSIYLEGWDIDNTDDVSEGAFELSAKFKIKRRW